MNILVKSSLLSIVLFFILSCDDGPSEIGTDFFQNGSFDIGFVDTLSVAVSTVVFDSLVTSQTGRLLVGYTKDEKLGEITSSAYLQLGTDNSQGIEGDSKYNYTALHLEYDGYSYYDTSTYLTLNVYQLDEDLELDDDGNIYNTSSFQIKSSLDGSAHLLGSVSFLPEPNFKDSVEIIIDNELGLQLYQMAIENNSTILNEDNFRKFFKGLVIVPDTLVRSCFIGFKTTASLRVYYFDEDEVPAEEEYISFSLTDAGGSNLHYNKIKANRLNTSLENIRTRREDISSTETGGLGFIQSGAGLALRIEIPHVKTLIQDNENLIISSAVLEIKPVKNSDRNNTPFAEYLSVYSINNLNEVYGELETPLVLSRDELLDRETKYTIDITSFVKAQIELQEFNQNALLFYPNESVQSSIDRLYLSDRTTESETKIIVNYMQLK